MPSVSFDRVADRYDDTRGGEQRGRLFAGTIAPLLTPGPVLEVGIGTGVVAAGLAELGHATTGVDISTAMLSHAVRRLGPCVAVADAHHLPVADARISSVVLAWVLHLVHDPVAVLGEARRVISPDGRVVVSIAGWVFEQTDELSELYALLDAATGRRRQDVDDLVRLAVEAGLALETVVSTPSEDFARVPTREAGLIESRAWSSLFAVPDDRWVTEVVPLVERFRAVPEPDRPRVVRGHQQVLAFTRA